MSNAYCVVFLLCFSSSWVPYVGSFSWLPLQYSLTFIFLDKKLFCIVLDFLSYIANMYNCTYKNQNIESFWVNLRFVYVSLFYFLILYSFICCFVFILSLVPFLLYIWIVYSSVFSNVYLSIYLTSTPLYLNLIDHCLPQILTIFHIFIHIKKRKITSPVGFENTLIKGSIA